MQDNKNIYGSKTEAAGVGDEVKFRLTGKLPSNYDQYTLGYQFTFTDTLSKGLTLKGTKDLDFEDGKALDYDSRTSELDTETGFVVNAVGVYGNDGNWNEDKKVEIKVSSHKSDGTHTQHDSIDYAYNATVTKDNTTGKQELKIEFPCLKEILINDETVSGVSYTLGGDSEHQSVIYIDYIAVVDEDAVVSPKGEAAGELNGNTNTAVLTYSDNPQSYEDIDNTTEEKATVYTFGLDMIKVDAAEFLRSDGYDEKNTKAGLEGAQFAVIRRTGEKGSYEWAIAEFKWFGADESSPDNLPPSFKENGYNSICGWQKITSADASADDFNKEWIFDVTKGTKIDSLSESSFFGNTYTLKKEYEGAYLETDSTKKYFNVTSLKNGALNISGLDNNVEYTIVETATPTKRNDKVVSYAMIEPFTITLQAELADEEYNGRLSTGTDVSNLVENGKSFTFEDFIDVINPKGAAGGVEAKNNTTGSANMFVANFKYIDLPSTGGVGTYLFYILGAGGLAISFLLFKMSRKKAVN